MRVNEVGVLKPLTCAARRAGEAVMADTCQVGPKVVEDAGGGVGGSDMDVKRWVNTVVSIKQKTVPKSRFVTECV